MWLLSSALGPGDDGDASDHGIGEIELPDSQDESSASGALLASGVACPVSIFGAMDIGFARLVTMTITMS